MPADSDTDGSVVADWTPAPVPADSDTDGSVVYPSTRFGVVADWTPAPVPAESDTDGRSVTDWTPAPVPAPEDSDTDGSVAGIQKGQSVLVATTDPGRKNRWDKKTCMTVLFQTNRENEHPLTVYRENTAVSHRSQRHCRWPKTLKNSGWLWDS